MAEILEETALLEGRNILVDGSLRDGAWYAIHVKDLRRRFPQLRVAIIHVRHGPIPAADLLDRRLGAISILNLSRGSFRVFARGLVCEAEFRVVDHIAGGMM